MSYPGLDTLNATADLGNIFLYLNSVTNNMAMPSMLFAYFVIVLLAGFFAEVKFGRPRFAISFAAGAFSTFGLAIIMSLKTGVLNPIYLVICLGLSILGAIWIFLTSESQV